MAHSPVVVWIGNIPSTLKLPHHLNLANIDVLRFGFYDDNWHNGTSIQRNTQIQIEGWWLSFHQNSEQLQSEFRHDTSSIWSWAILIWPFLSICFVSPIGCRSAGNHCMKQKKVQSQVGKGRVFLTCSLAAKSYTMITQDYITNFVN